MNGKAIRPYLGHIVFFFCCVLVGGMIGLIAMIGCGYGGTECHSVGLQSFWIAAIGLLVVGYLIRFSLWYVALGLLKIQSKVTESSERKPPPN